MTPEHNGDLTTDGPARPVDPAIIFSHVTKTYYILQRATPRIGAWIVNKLFEYLRREPFNALEDISLMISQGELVGLLGANGAGKSTILKLTAGIIQPTSGEIRVRGKIASLLELGTGFHPELTGMENIFYNGALMGMTRQEVLERLEQIIAFSGLERFLYEPVKHYSTGMYARLASSVALHLDPDVILADEILAVGDQEFQQRGVARMLELHERGVTIVLVTHQVSTARDVCDRLIWMDSGRLQLEGDPRKVAKAYEIHMSQFNMLPRHYLSPSRTVVSQSNEEVPREADLSGFIEARPPRLVRCRAENRDGEPLEEIVTGQPLRLVFDIDEGGVEAPYRLAICARWENGQILFEDQTDWLEPGQNPHVVYEVPSWPLMRAVIQISAALLGEGDPPVVLDRSIDAIRFRTLTERIPVEDVAIVPPAVWTLD